MKLSLAPLVFAGACAAPVESITAVEIAQTPECDDWQCGTNSPVIANHELWDLSLVGAVNKQGFAIQDFRDKNDEPYKLGMEAGRFIAYPTLPNQQVLEGGDLVGARIYLTRDGSESYVIEISGVNKTEYWAKIDGKQAVTLETYLLTWDTMVEGTPLGEPQNLCNHAIDKPQLTMNGLHTTVFEGERLDAATKTIDPTIDTSWFNLGCAGSALAKLQLMGHTEAAQKNGFETTIDERQAALKMITADYCGNGFPFTVGGQPLDWTDDRGTMSYVYKFPQLEARWKPSGASCLNKPRVVANPTTDSMALFPTDLDEMRYFIKQKCGYVPEECEGDASEFDGFHLLSANPPPPSPPPPPPNP